MNKPRATVMLAFIAGIVFTLTIVAKPRGNATVTDAMQRTIDRMYPGGKITEAEIERQLLLFTELTVRVEGKEYDILMDDEGRVILIKQTIRISDLPGVAESGIRSIEQKEKIQEAEKIEVFAEVQPVSLTSPRTEYSAKFNKSGRELEVYVDESGGVVKIMKKLRYED